MATKTTNYEFIKPDYTEAANIAVINGNMDAIDSKLKEVEDASGKLSDLAGKPNGYASLGADGKVPSSQLPAAADSVPISGGTMTGPLILSGAPERDLQAATKRYVDNFGLKHDSSGFYMEYTEVNE